jgi:hypothetical protein
MPLKDVPEPRDLMVVEVVDISVLHRAASHSATTKYRQLIAGRTIADLKRQIRSRFPDVEICSQAGEVLSDDLTLGAVARNCPLPLQLIPTGSVRHVRIGMEHHQPEDFLVDEKVNAEGIRAILRGHYPGLSPEIGLFDSTRELGSGSLVVDLRGGIITARRRSGSNF